MMFMVILSLTERVKLTDELFNPLFAYSFARGLVTALNSLYIEYGDKPFSLEDYVLEVIEYFPIKVSLREYPKLCTLTQLTLF